MAFFKRKVEVHVVIGFEEAELDALLQDPPKLAREIRRARREELNAPANDGSRTLAIGNGAEKIGCPHCGKFFEPTGLNNHITRKHKKEAARLLEG